MKKAWKDDNTLLIINESQNNGFGATYKDVIETERFLMVDGDPDNVEDVMNEILVGYGDVFDEMTPQQRERSILRFRKMIAEIIQKERK